MLGPLRRLLVAGALATLASSAVADPTAGGAWPALTPYGGYLLVGGGVADFREHAVRDFVRLGGAWDVRLGIGSRRRFAGELAYVGTFARAGALGRYLGTSGGEAVLRVQAPAMAGGVLVEPFGIAGAGWAHFELRKGTPLARRATGDMLVVPVGIGITGGRGPFLLEVRLTHRWTIGEAPVSTARGGRASLRGWAITSSVGWEL